MIDISPGEFNLLADNPVIRTKCPYDKITSDMVLKRVRNGNLSVGDKVLVQCLSHDGSKLLAETDYRVTERRASLKTIELNDRDIRQVEDIFYAVERVSDWRTFGMLLADAPIVRPGAISTYAAPPPLTITWNVGKRGYDIKAGDEVVGFHADKETAQRMASGELPLSGEEAA